MKYLGGKQRLGKHIAPVLKELMHTLKINGYDVNTYFEPFCGSLGVLKNMTDIEILVHANDNHADLIQMWKELQEGTFIYPSGISEEEYLSIKQTPSPNEIICWLWP